MLSYFDLTRETVRLNLPFLVTNAGCTWVTLDLGFRYYGYGYFLTSLVTATVAFTVLAHQSGSFHIRRSF